MKKLLLGLIGLLFAIPVFAACPSGQVEQTYTSATGTVTQNGTPTPTNPIEPVFYKQGDMVLRKVGDYADSYDATTGIITRRVGEYIVKGTEAWSNYTAGTRRYWFDITTKEPTASSTSVLCNKYHVVSHNGDSSDNWILNSKGSQSIIMKDSRYETPEDWKAYLADQYAAGTPVIIYYPLKEAKYTTEYVGTEWCEGIKIATTAYNTARFSPVVTELNDTIATIRNVVTNTINQTKAIADLQATKQTRPDETCPAGKKCLLVEDNDGTPHWYEIIENAYGLPSGYTGLEYVTFDGTENTGAYIDTGLKYYTDIPNTKIRILADAKIYNGSNWQIVAGNVASKTAYVGTSSNNYFYYSAGVSDTSTNVQNPYKRCLFDLNTPAKKLTIKNIETNTNIVNLSNINVREQTTVYPVMIGTYNSGDAIAAPRAHMDLYSIKIYNNGTLVFDGIPAQNGNEVGIYDLISNSFKTSSSTALTAGPVVQ